MDFRSNSKVNFTEATTKFQLRKGLTLPFTNCVTRQLSPLFIRAETKMVSFCVVIFAHTLLCCSYINWRKEVINERFWGEDQLVV
jgi:hypothetical protein